MSDAVSARLARQAIAGAALVVVGIAVIAGVVWWQRPRLVPIEISQQTTYLTTPTRPDGWVDYREAVDWMRRAGLDAGGTNAAGPLARALGPDVLQTGADPDAVLDRIGGRPDGGAQTLPPLRVVERQHGGGGSGDALALGDRAWLGARCETTDGEQAALEPIRRWVSQAASQLATLREASQAKALYVRLPRDPRFLDFSRVGRRSADAADALRCRAAMTLLQGDAAASWDDAVALWKLGVLIARSGTPGEYAIGTAFWKAAMDATADLAASDGTSAERLAAMRRDLGAIAEFPPATEPLMIRRLEALDGFATPLVAKARSDQSAAGPLAPPGTAAQLGAINRRFDALEAAVQIADPQQRIARFDEVAAVDAPSDDVRALLGDQIRAASYRRLASTALALAARQRAKGSLPASLAELGDVAKDPGGGAPFGYAPGGRQFRLYGVGPDGRDDGGDPAKDVVVATVEPPRLAPP